MKTFEFQKDLKRLPIPDLNHTMITYLQTCLPFFESSQQQAEYTAIVKDFFQGGLGEKLQQRLITHDKFQETSWLEKWWLQYAYLSWRNSVLVHSNWFVLAQPAAGMPLEPNYVEGFTEFQIMRAARFSVSFLEYKHMLDNQLIEPEKTRNGYLDMSQYLKMFGVTRVPKPDCDVLVGYNSPSKAKHIIFMVLDQIFTVHVYDEISGERIGVRALMAQFEQCINLALKKSLQPPICILSGQHRDDWSKHHGYLLKISSKNRDSFEKIETSLFAVSLDHRIIPHGFKNQAKYVFHGFDGHNRWFDKSFTICVANDGRLGVNGEHSPLDAVVPAMLIDFAVNREKYPIEPETKLLIAPVSHLEWDIDEEIRKAFGQAQKYINETIDDSDLDVLHYTNYGAEFIKKIGKVSPDAYSQLCLQLAFYRNHGHLAGVYESASTRAFLYGRTETCRSLTNDAAIFVKSFDNPNLTAHEKYALFQKASKAHIEYITKASNAMGVDRHLLGLKLCMKIGESHEIYSHPIFAKSSKWQLSTSALFSGERLVGTGFGTVYPDGYGMNYMLGNNVIKIGIESKNSCPSTSTRSYIQTLCSVYDDVAKMCSSVNGGAKL